MIKKITQLARDWALVIAIISGIIGYFIYIKLPLPASVHPIANDTVAVVQPLLIFLMLLLTFSRISLHSLRLKTWHLWLLLVQCSLFTLLGIVLILLPHSSLRIILEGAMILLICPTATAAAVVTKKLGGDINDITTYTILINLLVSVLIPALVPLVHPNPELNFINASMLILGKVFPLLLLPLITAILMRYLMPRLHRRLASMYQLSFYLWAVALTLAIAVTTRSIVHSSVELSTQLWLVVVSLACCALQFAMGRVIGKHYGATITAGQALGQKNTVVAIWIGYTFFTPVTSIAGGFYSIWHNLYNSYQLAQARKNH